MSRDAIYTCPHCSRLIPLRSFRLTGPYTPRYCPSCGGDRWPSWYVQQGRIAWILLVVYATGVIGFFAGLSMQCR